jgi:hypothetical protein
MPRTASAVVVPRARRMRPAFSHFSAAASGAGSARAANSVVLAGELALQPPDESRPRRFDRELIVRQAHDVVGRADRREAQAAVAQPVEHPARAILGLRPLVQAAEVVQPGGEVVLAALEGLRHPAELEMPLEHEHPPAALGQRRGRGEPSHAGADDDRVVRICAHGSIRFVTRCIRRKGVRFASVWSMVPARYRSSSGA